MATHNRAKQPARPGYWPAISRRLARLKRQLSGTRFLGLPLWFWLSAAGVWLLVSLCGLTVLGLGLMAGGDIAPGVRVAGIEVGGMNSAEAATHLQQEWQARGITVTDGQQTWQVPAAELGLALDAEASAQVATRHRGLDAWLGTAHLPPVLDVNLNQTAAGLEALKPTVEQPPRNAGVQLVNGQVQPTAPVYGQLLDVDATLAQLQGNAANVLADGVLELIMVSVAPQVTDSSALVAEAQALLSNPLIVRGFDPITNQWLDWTLPPDQWSAWLTATSDASQASGLALTLDDGSVRAFLQGRDAELAATGRYLKVDEAVQAVRQAVQQRDLSPWLRVYHQPGEHTVRPGESLTSIAWDYGMPYPWLQAANPGVGALSAGQTITIPSPDEFVPLPVVPNKRIVVNMSQQRVKVYENGALKWDWVASTGIADSPTWPGVFQIRSHDGTAYAGNWNLWMPHFMSVYQPVPSIDFFNGFHGFPSRNGNQLLWQNSLGYQVTYGCILLSSDNASLLYEWAEDGVVVEIQA